MPGGRVIDCVSASKSHPALLKRKNCLEILAIGFLIKQPGLTKGISECFATVFLKCI
jgi:hypothetical protein